MDVHLQKRLMSDLCEITSSKRIYVADYQSEGVPFYRSKEIIEKHIGTNSVSTELYISEKKYSEIKAKFGAPEQGDVLLTSVGTLGVPYVVKSNERFYFKDGNLTWFRNFNELNSQFLYYWLQSSLGKAELKKCTIGSSQQAFTIVLLKNIEIELPTLNIQEQIVKILIAYDDLIENNNSRIRILEEMAQTIYREWFVKFRFPGYEKVKMVNSELGKIPEGWEVKQLDGIIDIISGFAFKSKTYIEKGKYGLVTIRNVQDGRFRTDCDNKIDTIPENMPNSCLLNTGDILLSLTGNVGRTCLVYGYQYVLNQRVAKLIPKISENKAYIYFMFNQIDFRKQLELISTGAAQQNLSPIEMGEIKFCYPANTTLLEFSKMCIPMLEQILILMQKNFVLINTRDVLLPKLISGQIDVKNLNIEVNNV
jgi:type I restriction enzyme S subunit